MNTTTHQNSDFLQKLLAFAGFLFFIGILFFAWTGLQGYRLYKTAVTEVPIKEKVESIKSMDGFTEYEELPDIYIDAVISVEDKRFREHHGIDYTAICRAVLYDLRTLSFSEGGSTITQQFVKNAYFTQEKKIARKFAEVFAAKELERQCSKTEIFELYVNTIYFGSGYYGIREAANGYYGKSPSELTDYEAVMLAGLPNAPSAYALDKYPKRAEKRMKQVLEQMVKCKVLSETEAEKLM